MADTKAKKPQRTRPKRRKPRKRRGVLPFVLVFVAIIFAMGFVFRVSEIEVVGSTVYTDEEIISASTIQEGDNLFFINNSSATSRISSKLPAIDGVVVNRIWPNKIQIVIEESVEVAYINVEGSYWTLDRSLRFLESSTAVSVANKVEVRGITATNPIIGTSADDSKASFASEIFELIADYGLSSYVTWVDFEDIGYFEFDYEDRFIVRMSYADDLEYEFRKLLTAVSELSANDRALLDLTIDENVHFTPR